MSPQANGKGTDPCQAAASPPPPAPRSTHSSDAAASGANCGIARNRSTGRGVAPWDTSRASCTIMPLRLPSIRPFLLFSSRIRARVCRCLMSRAPRPNEGSELGLGRSRLEEKRKSHDHPSLSPIAPSFRSRAHVAYLSGRRIFISFRIPHRVRRQPKSAVDGASPD